MELQIDDLLLALREGSDPFPCHEGWEIDYYTYKLVCGWDCQEGCWKIFAFNEEE